MTNSLKKVLPSLLLCLLFAGCATKDYVHEYVDGQLVPVSTRIGEVDQRADAANKANAAGLDAANQNLAGVTARVGRSEADIARYGTDIAQLSKTAQEALERANQAGRTADKAARGKLVYEVVLSDDKLNFGLEKSGLSKAAMAKLDAFAAKLKSDNANVFIEIQGHTDATGSPAINLALGESRADEVRRFLNIKGGIPLHRMSVISYGESAPVASNKNLAGRKQNRRVVLVVIQ